MPPRSASGGAKSNGSKNTGAPNFGNLLQISVVRHQKVKRTRNGVHRPHYANNTFATDVKNKLRLFEPNEEKTFHRHLLPQYRLKRSVTIGQDVRHPQLQSVRDGPGDVESQHRHSPQRVESAMLPYGVGSFTPPTFRDIGHPPQQQQQSAWDKHHDDDDDVKSPLRHSAPSLGSAILPNVLSILASSGNQRFGEHASSCGNISINIFNIGVLSDRSFESSYTNGKRNQEDGQNGIDARSQRYHGNLAEITSNNGDNPIRELTQQNVRSQANSQSTANLHSPVVLEYPNHHISPPLQSKTQSFNGPSFRQLPNQKWRSRSECLSPTIRPKLQNQVTHHGLNPAQGDTDEEYSVLEEDTVVSESITVFMGTLKL